MEYYSDQDFVDLIEYLQDLQQQIDNNTYIGCVRQATSYLKEMYAGMYVFDNAKEWCMTNNIQLPEKDNEMIEQTIICKQERTE